MSMELDPRSGLVGHEYVLLGGGSGTAEVAPDFIQHVLSEEPISRFNIIVPVTDSGSSTGVLRDMYGGPAVGDGRKVLATLSQNQAGAYFGKRLGAAHSVAQVDVFANAMAQEFEYGSAAEKGQADEALDQMHYMAADLLLYSEAGLRGHTIGNLVLTALCMQKGIELGSAMNLTSRWLQLDPRVNVMPVSNDSARLMLLDNGKVHSGEAVIDVLDVDDPDNALVYVEPENKSGQSLDMLHSAKEAVQRADRVVLLPSSRLTSMGALLRYPGMVESLKLNAGYNGKLLSIANLTVGRDSRGMGLSAVTESLGRMAGRQIDAVLANSDFTELPEGEEPLVHDHAIHPPVPAYVVPTIMLRKPRSDSRDVANDPHAVYRSTVATDGSAAASALISAGSILDV